MGRTTKSVRATHFNFRTQEGFTLIETIIALAVLVMLSSLVPLLLAPIQKHPPSSQLEETALFFSMLGKEFREGSSFQITNNVLFIKKTGGDEISFSRYRTLIRKQINGMGHEVWLQEIQLFTPFKHSDKLLEIKIIDSEGNEYNRSFQRIE
jgi:competence protein ComGF